MAENIENTNAELDEEDGIIELEGEDGTVERFAFVDAIQYEYNGETSTYYALVPEAAMDDENGADEFVILKTMLVNGEEMLATVDNDDEYETVGEIFMDRFSDLAAYEDEE